MPPARITSPMATGGMYCGMSRIHTRLVGSIEIYSTRTKISPSLSSSIDSRTRSKSSRLTNPSGRCLRRSCRLIVDMRVTFGIEPLNRRGAAVDSHFRGRDEAALVGGEIQHGIGDIVDFAQPLHWNAAREFASCFLFA